MRTEDGGVISVTSAAGHKDAGLTLGGTKVITRKDGNRDALQSEATRRGASRYSPLKSVNLFVQNLKRLAADTLVMLWPWPLILWPWTVAVYPLWRDQHTYRILEKSNNPRLSYSDLNIGNLRAGRPHVDFKGEWISIIARLLQTIMHPRTKFQRINQSTTKL